MHRRELSKAIFALAATARAAQPAVAPTLSPSVVDPRDYGARGDGLADDSAPLEAALAAGRGEGVALLLPHGCTFRVTRYLEVRGNTTVVLLGRVRLANRAAGFFTNGGANVSIIGLKVGVIADETVLAGYRFNTQTAGMAPAIHIRSTRNVAIHGLNISHCQQGVLISNAAETVLRPGEVHLTQANPENCSVENCDIQFCEMSGIASFNARDSSYASNHVYRCGDGGMWMMGARNCEILSNHRISPYAVAADVAAHGPNNPSHPGTWNDEQGIELENCHGVRVADNVVRGMWAVGIDVKNGCDRVVVAGNRVDDCENASICVRDGDAVKNACHKVSISGNAVSGHGTRQYDRPTAQRGAIRAGECFVADITGNVIYGYRGTPGIVCEGPGAYQARWYPRNPHQGSLDVSDNRVEFKSDSFELEREPQLGALTLAAIAIHGEYDSVRCNDNCITGDRYLSVDARRCADAAISLRYVRGNGTFYPMSASISANQVCGWGNWAIMVAGLPQMKGSGLTASGNSIGPVAGGGGIHLSGASRAVCSQNAISQVVAGSGYPGIWLEGGPNAIVEGVVACGNQIVGGWDEGANAMTYGLRLDHCGDCTLTDNAIGGAMRGPVGVFHAHGPIFLSGTTGFPRKGTESPQGRIVAHYPGEMYLDATSGAWWIAVSAGTKRWARAAS